VSDFSTIRRIDYGGRTRNTGNVRVTHLDEDLLEARVDALFVQFVAIERQALDELLHGPLRFEREERETERDVAPLARVFAEPETLAKLLDDALGLLFLK